MASFDLDFEISLSTGCCDQLQICDTTGDYNPNNPTSACSGYNVTDDSVRTTNIFRDDVASTSFNWVMPNGTRFTAADMGFLPAQYASVSFTLGAGTAGDWIIAILEDYSLGNAIFVSSLSQVVVDLVNNINLNSEITGWYAYYVDYTITIYNLDSGVEFNDNVLEIVLNSGTTITATVPTPNTAGANDLDDCQTFRVSDLYGRHNCPDGKSCWPDGVYSVTYVIKDDAGVELARKHKKFFLDCNVSKCIYNQMKSLADCGCDCGDDKWKKVLNLKMTLEALNNAFNDGNDTCANEGIIDLLERCKNLCLDC